MNTEGPMSHVLVSKSAPYMGLQREYEKLQTKYSALNDKVSRSYFIYEATGHYP